MLYLFGIGLIRKFLLLTVFIKFLVLYLLLASYYMVSYC